MVPDPAGEDCGVEVEELVHYADGSYSTTDDGGRGDIFALVPRVYPVPHYLAEYFDLAKALRVVTSTCALQQGKCWVVKRSAMLPRGGQRCGQGECRWRSPNSPGLASELAELRAGTLAERLGGQPMALATARGLAVVNEGTVLPLWQRIYRNSPADHFIMQGPSETYSAAVRAAMVIADRTRKERLVYAWGEGGKPIPMVYVHPGGLVRSARKNSPGIATQVDPMDDFELRQAIAASSGASIMPFNM